MSPELENTVIDPASFLSDAGITEPQSVPPENPPKDKEPKDKEPKDEKGKQFAELKRAKERAEKALADKEKEIEDFKKKLNETNEFAPLKPIAEHIKAKFKAEKIDEEVVNKFIEHNRTRKKTLQEKEAEVAKKEETIKLLNLEQSQEWRDGYVKPLQESRNALFATLANIDDKGEVKNAKIIESLLGELIQLDKDGNPLNPIQVKQKVVAFAKKYEEATGEEWDMPPIGMINSSIKDFASKVVNAATARKNWSQALEQAKKEELYTQAKNHEETIKRETASRNFVTDKVIREFDFTQFEGILDEDDFTDAIRENNNYFIKLLKGDKEVQKKQYPDMLIELAKASKFDAVIARIRELEQELDKMKEINKGGLPQRGGRKPDNQSKHDKVDLNSDPKSFLE